MKSTECRSTVAFERYRTLRPIVAGLALSACLSACLVAPAAADPPDPSPGATRPVREQNLDGAGLIRVHEQGIADVNVTNTTLDVQGSVDVANFPTSLEVSNLPAVQQVEVVGGALAGTLVPVTTVQALPLQAPADGVLRFQSLPTVDATSVLIQAFEGAELTVVLGTPLAGVGITALWDPDGQIGSRHLTFVHPLPIDEVGVACFNETEDCFASVWVIGH